MSDAPDTAGVDDDADILLAQRQVAVGGRQVTVRELTFAQALDLHADVQAVLAPLQAQYTGDGIDSDSVTAALAQHPSQALTLLAASTGEPADWLAALGPADGYLLMVHFVSVHVGFFAMRLELLRQVALSRAKRSASASASPASSATGTPLTH